MLNNLKRFPAFIDRNGNKVPIYSGWKTIATNDSEQLKKWEEQHKGPNFLWGIPCGEDNGIFALDVDVKDGVNGFNSLKDKNIELPYTAWQQTRSGGCHFVFKYPKGSRIGNRVKFLQGLDTRGETGWIADYGITNSTVPLAEIPQWLFEAAQKPEPIDNLKDFEKSEYKIESALAEQMITNILDLVRNAPPQQGNDVLNAQAFEMGRLVTAGAVELDIAKMLLFKAAIERGRPEYEARATIESGLTGGLKNPLLCPFDANPRLAFVLPPEPPKPETPEDWIPRLMTEDDLEGEDHLRRPELFKDWASQDIILQNAMGGVGKTTLALYEAVCMRLGDRFLGFENMRPGGKTLFITGEDTAEKLMQTVGKMIRQMKIPKGDEKRKLITSGVFIKGDNEMCIVTRDRSGIWYPDPVAYNKLAAAIKFYKPDKVVIDPLSSFWGSEIQVNDMTRGVIKFAQRIVKEFGVGFEMIHHLSSDSAKSKDMGQFGGRGGSMIPSHARIVRTLRRIETEELGEFIDFTLEEDEAPMLCNISKYTDGSKMLHKPFVIVRNGHLFRPAPMRKLKPKEIDGRPLPETEIMTWILEERGRGRYPSKPIIKKNFGSMFKQDIITQTLETLRYFGHAGKRLSLIDNPNEPGKSKVYTIIDDKGNEI